MNRFDLRLKNLSVRTCDEMLLNLKPHTKAEIVKWHNDCCVTIAVFDRDKEDGWNIKLFGGIVLRIIQ